LSLTTIVRYKKNKFVVFLLIILFGIWSFPNVLSPTTGGLDPSWNIALHMAKIQDLVWGQDLMMTNGPLAYLTLTINIDQTLWNHSFFYKIVVHILFFIVIGLFSYKTKNPLLSIIALGILSVFLVLVIPKYYPMLGLMLGWYLYLEHSKKYLFLIPLSFTPAFFSFVKADVFLGSFSIIASSWIILITQKRWKDVIISSGAYTLFIVLIWLIMKFPIDVLDNYFFNMISISSGYSIAMSIDRLFFPVYFSIPLWGVYFWWIIDSYKKNSDLKFFFISAGMLFLMYKLGVVREGGHTLHFFIFWSAIMLIFLIIANKKKISKALKWTTISLIIFFSFSAMFTAYILWPLEKYSNIDNEFVFNGIEDSFKRIFNIYSKSKIQYIPNYLNFLYDDSSFDRIRNSEKEKIIQSYPIIPPRTLQLIANQTVDVFPWDNALLYAYDFNWKPRVILQSIGAYTPELDMLDSESLQKTDSPKYLLYEWKSIDGRFAAFDTPITYRTILCNYHLVDKFEKWNVFEKNQTTICSETLIEQKQVQFGEKVTVPKPREGYVFVKIEINQNTLGKFSDIIYKSPHVFIKLNENERSHRFIYPNAVGGLILAVHPQIPDTPLLVYDINSFTIHTDYENYFDNTINIEFFEIKKINYN